MPNHGATPSAPTEDASMGGDFIRVAGLDVLPIVGLEIHIQLATRTKMFCGCPVEFGAEPNSRVCPVCLGLPGALPVINRRAVELAVRCGLALHCRVARVTRWDRKSYNYPDLPKGYQISQYELPLCVDGRFELAVDGRMVAVRIRRAHLEEDAGKNLHDVPGCTLVDLNRAGTPLLEVVTEPDLHSATQARELAVQLARLVRYLGVSAADMQKGHMRFEPNINLLIRRDGREYRTPIVEVKNLNSFRALERAVEHEVRRQAECWLADGRTAAPGNKSNRGWDDQREVTIPQREKEEAQDYRYFPDPDLLPLTTDATWEQQLRESLPELPVPRTLRFARQYGLALRDAAALVDDRATADLLDQAAQAGGDPATLGRQFLSFWAMHAHQRGVSIAGLGIPPSHLAELANLVHQGTINATAAAQLAEAMLADPRAPAELARQRGLVQSRDADRIAAWVDQVLAANPQAVHDAMHNPRKLQAARGFLVGQVMKLSGGQADPKLVAQIVQQRLETRAT